MMNAPPGGATGCLGRCRRRRVRGTCSRPRIPIAPYRIADYRAVSPLKVRPQPQGERKRGPDLACSPRFTCGQRLEGARAWHERLAGAPGGGSAAGGGGRAGCARALAPGNARAQRPPPPALRAHPRRPPVRRTARARALLLGAAGGRGPRPGGGSARARARIPNRRVTRRGRQVPTRTRTAASHDAQALLLWHPRCAAAAADPWLQGPRRRQRARPACAARPLAHARARRARPPARPQPGPRSRACACTPATSSLRCARPPPPPPPACLRRFPAPPRVLPPDSPPLSCVRPPLPSL